MTMLLYLYSIHHYYKNNAGHNIFIYLYGCHNSFFLGFLIFICACMIAENVCNREILADKETDDKIVNVDDNYQDPQLCATIACDIYKHLRASEVCHLFFHAKVYIYSSICFY